jgi:hypothetical protein
MPKTDINRPLNAICVHYYDFEYIEDKSTYKVQIYCKQLKEQKGKQLWIYPNQDTNFEYLPDVIYPSVTSAANNASCSYLQMGIHYGKTNKKVWGFIEKYV